MKNEILEKLKNRKFYEKLNINLMDNKNLRTFKNIKNAVRNYLKENNSFELTVILNEILSNEEFKNKLPKEIITELFKELEQPIIEINNIKNKKEILEKVFGKNFSNEIYDTIKWWYSEAENENLNKLEELEEDVNDLKDKRSNLLEEKAELEAKLDELNSIPFEERTDTEESNISYYQEEISLIENEIENIENEINYKEADIENLEKEKENYENAANYMLVHEYGLKVENLRKEIENLHKVPLEASDLTNYLAAMDYEESIIEKLKIKNNDEYNKVVKEVVDLIETVTNKEFLSKINDKKKISKYIKEKTKILLEKLDNLEINDISPELKKWIDKNFNPDKYLYQIDKNKYYVNKGQIINDFEKYLLQNDPYLNKILEGKIDYEEAIKQKFSNMLEEKKEKQNTELSF